MQPNRSLAALLILVPGLPMAWALAAALAAGLDLSAWRALAADPQWLKATATTLWTGIAASVLATGVTAWLLCSIFPGPAWARLVRLLGPMLAVPHVAFAIGLLALIAPSGWLLRAVSPWLTGFDAPPPWVTTQDPWGLGLIAVLTLKEVPFLLWAAGTQLQRGDVALRLARELDAARTMGYQRGVAWRRVVWPQLWPRLRWPLLAVLAYGITVVDVALVIGPGSPPSLAVLAWTWLQDADPAQNAQGAAAAWSLAITLAVLSALFWRGATLPVWRTRRTTGQRGRPGGSYRHQLPHHFSVPVVTVLTTYAVVMLALLAGSVAGVWAFPSLMPQTLTAEAWLSVGHSFNHVTSTLTLALASAATSLVWCVAWLELAPVRWDQLLRRVLYLPLVLPAVLWLVGLHAFVLRWGFDASWQAVWLAHCLATLPYVLIALSPAYLGFDARYWAISASLGKSRWQFLLHVKWPVLRSALSGAAAVGFAVSVAQYLPTLFMGAGRITTVTTEAVTLASGAQRSLTSAYAALQWLLPVLGFGLAAWLGKPRRFEPTAKRPLS
jgi:putative thiamine transport system permease protein